MTCRMASLICGCCRPRRRKRRSGSAASVKISRVLCRGGRACTKVSNCKS